MGSLMSGVRPAARHEISRADIDLLARGCAGADVARLLRRAERSRRLLMLRAVLDEAERHPAAAAGPVPPPGDAWDLLERVEQESPFDLEAVLAYPFVGNWAGHTLRRLRGSVDDPSPLWMQVGHVHGIAAAAAIRAGLGIQVLIPVRDDTVALPTLGVAHLPNRVNASSAREQEAPVAELCSASGRTEIRRGGTIVRLPSELTGEAPGWSGLRRLTAVSGKHTLSLLLDDVDPYRGLYGPRRPAPTKDAELHAWQRELEEAWNLVCHHLPQQAGAMSTVLTALVPVPAPGPFQVASASSGDAFGGVVMSRPENPAMLAATLVHETQHIVLGGLLHLVGLHDNDPEARLYAPWRDDPRPVGGLFQGVYAFFGVTRFWRAVYRAQDEATQRAAAFEFARWRAATWRALDAMTDVPALTAIGKRVLKQIREEMEPWLAEPVAEDAAAAAEKVAGDHRVAWLLHHVRPDERTVTEMTDAWLYAISHPQSEAAPGHRDLPADALIPDTNASWVRTRADLICCGAVPSRTLDSPFCADVEAGASSADQAFAADDHVEAWHGYRAEIASSASPATSWVGFALAWASLGTEPGSELLLRRPALVREVYRRLSALGHRPEPDALAGWIAARWPHALPAQD
ncbi:HEXXH motif domain-containing protein [Streptomyces fungicidicus]|uniref:HEXXH motif domain-containing protein n=1 Tax=Streptomyces fungicidicus TaxID=68203 RepID=UPI00381EE5C3